MNVDLILQGELAGDYASPEAVAARQQHIVHRIGTVHSVAAVDQTIKSEVKHTPGVYEWHDGSYTVFDIREK